MVTSLTAPRPEREHTLVAAAQNDPGAFAALYEQHVARIHAYALRCVHDGMAADDVVSETFHRALENLARYEWRGAPFSAWLFRIARNAIATRYRRAPTLPLEAADSLQDRDPGPEATMLRSEQRREVQAAVAALPSLQHQAVRLHYGQGLRTREIALMLGRSEGTIKQLLHRARRRMHQRLATGADDERGRHRP